MIKYIVFVRLYVVALTIQWRRQVSIDNTDKAIFNAQGRWAT